MKKINIFYILSFSLILCGCNKKEPLEEPQEEIDNITLHININGEFNIINFADTQFDNVNDLNAGTILDKTIRNALDNNTYDLITFTGDNAWGSNVKECYRALCDYMDKYQTPYAMVFGNHDRENASAIELIDIVNNSQYGIFINGKSMLNTNGNYYINIVNNNNELIHKLVMMDSRDYLSANPYKYKYVQTPIDGMIYNKFLGRPFYGSASYDNVKDEQLEWYKNIIDPSIESTLFIHIPFIEYCYAIEEYKKAISEENIEEINKHNSIGLNRITESISSPYLNYGFFDLIKEKGSTKNIICGHDHSNDFSIVYEGIRLTYALKTGDECYWYNETMNGYTTISINSNGNASITQNYFNPYL